MATTTVMFDTAVETQELDHTQGRRARTMRAVAARSLWHAPGGVPGGPCTACARANLQCGSSGEAGDEEQGAYGAQCIIALPDAEFSAVLVTLCETLAGHLVGEQSGCHCEVDDVWGVVQRAGEYRPLRSHRNRKSPVGFSCLMDLQLPPSLSPDNHERPSKGAYGFHDGLHNLIWKADRSNDRLELIHPGIVQCELLTGYVYIFPQWLQQLTYPFSGEGERIWVAANVALFTPTRPEHP
eukprot:CAMPEP_0177438950 /NCGR_PEP_ID=MMETSP0369-20130122/3041_1 /TAXON_ID=447022 ORGANISM="Scrippsiella hangoei-like, Strain SHHI-4" /NCGR_SAMPLE_ID=MMETSP0369 /ASSEMBLY_ACC=CAM_ASM_000364 /LENGTH=239 /DNA_ID=CAMNT_0018910577 /DNA_START=24 /DNA_END=744 /DNA_ORIENTATION=-